MTIRMIHLTMPGTAGHLPEGRVDFDYDRTMTSSSYFRFPHLHGDLVTFVAEDDVWIAPLDGGRAWRVSSLQLPARNPRFTPDGKRLVWTVVQGTAPEVVIADVDGGGYRQLTFFGHSTTRVKGFTAGGRHRGHQRVPAGGKPPHACLPPARSTAAGPRNSRSGRLNRWPSARGRGRTAGGRGQRPVPRTGLVEALPRRHRRQAVDRRRRQRRV